MDILYLLIPLSVVLVLLIVAVFGWAIHSGQLDDLEREGERILEDEWVLVDGDQASTPAIRQESHNST
ncbi:MAG: cbb3-type cytochrome oxidase assembly protein CcoS [Burkholderiaceae bacterium]|nr:cbb3-type cytochrome oxidase assembly protein CcoS [Burkholderiaceae bacterium]